MEVGIHETIEVTHSPCWREVLMVFCVSIYIYIYIFFFFFSPCHPSWAGERAADEEWPADFGWGILVLVGDRQGL